MWREAPDAMATGAALPRARTLAAGQAVPWHDHSRVTDTLLLPARADAGEDPRPGRLPPGDTVAVGSNRPHRVEPTGDGGCRFLVVQGVGTYDYVPVEDA